MPFFLVLLGAPGAGKGTQASRLGRRIGLPHISSGDIFRNNLKEDTELGRVAAGYLDRGDLVPDDVTIAMIRNRLAEPDSSAGAILDGFPRTPAQAEAMEAMLAERGGRVDLVFYIRVRPEALVRRLAGRWMCRVNAQHIYHDEFRPPRQPGVCDVDGAELYQRDDDRPEAVSRRSQLFLDQTAPLIEYYRSRGNLVEIDGDRPVAQVTESMLDALPQGIAR